MEKQHEPKRLECDDCGKPEGYAIGNTILCADCFQLRGSSCAGSACDADDSQD